jgi:sugar (pentulose or hexulose) kinase
VNSDAANSIVNGTAVLGIELGSTRIKAVLIGEDFAPIASGSYDWENRLEDGVWTYALDDVWLGLRECYRALSDDAERAYGVPLTKLAAIGVSAMMHGYLVFDSEGKQLVPFRTWRNTCTEEAAAALSASFNFNIPQRWSIAHLYQAVLNNEPHVSDIAVCTTLAGYVHWRLTGENVIGVGDASGMFPIDSDTKQYRADLLDKFSELIAGRDISLDRILPRILRAGEYSGKLTEKGAAMLDLSGKLNPGIPFCPPEGDAGTGMTATNSVEPLTGNVSAGTSVFAMAVLDKPLSSVHTEIDMVTTPSGKPVAMVHCNTFTSDIDAWVKVFSELLTVTGQPLEKTVLYDTLYRLAAEADSDCGGLLSYNYYSGEPITGLSGGRPLVVRKPDGNFTLGNFMRSLIFSAMATLRIGMDILAKQENVTLKQMNGHGGFFKTETIGQRLMASALNVPVAVTRAAGEGGAWGAALLAAFTAYKSDGESLDAFLSGRVFANTTSTCVQPNAADSASFERYLERYVNGLAIEKAALAALT